MPARNSIKIYVENGYYHIYNRGVNKNEIFLCEQDYAVFLKYLKTCLSPRDDDALYKILYQTQNSELKAQCQQLLRLQNFYDNIELLSYCLMPNHFHFLLRQKEHNAISEFIRSLCTRYAMYFNKRYKRVGPLFQGKYKAVLVNSNEQLRYLSKYIHRNPIAKDNPHQNIFSQPSSYNVYLNIEKAPWINTTTILGEMNPARIRNYMCFVEEAFDYDENKEYHSYCLDKP